MLGPIQNENVPPLGQPPSAAKTGEPQETQSAGAFETVLQEKKKALSSKEEEAAMEMMAAAMACVQVSTTASAAPLLLADQPCESPVLVETVDTGSRQARPVGQQVNTAPAPTEQPAFVDEMQAQPVVEMVGAQNAGEDALIETAKAAAQGQGAFTDVAQGAAQDQANTLAATTTEVKAQPVDAANRNEAAAAFAERQKRDERAAGQAAQTETPVPVVTDYSARPQAGAVMGAGAFSQPVTQAASTALVDQVAKQLETAVSGSKNTLHLSLSPKELGGIEIRLTTDKDGVNVQILAEQARTGKLLESQLEQLRMTLTSADVLLNQLTITQQRPDSSSQQSQLFAQERESAGWKRQYPQGENDQPAEQQPRQKTKDRYSLVDYHV